MGVEPYRFEYTNHRGEVGRRSVIPHRVFYGTVPPFHPTPGWYMEAFDLDKGAVRHFDLGQIRQVTTSSVEAPLPLLAKTRIPHEISTRVIGAVPRYLTRLLRTNNAPWYVVGDAVVDLADGVRPKDLDILVVPRGMAPTNALFDLTVTAEYDPLTSAEIQRARILRVSHPGQLPANISVAPALDAFRAEIPVDIVGTAVRWDGEFFPTRAFMARDVAISRALFQKQRPGEDVELEIQHYVNRYRRRGYTVAVEVAG